MSVNINVNFYLISSARSYIRKTEGKISKKQEQETPEPIFMFVSYGKGKRFRAPVGKKVAPKDWDDKKKRVKSSDPRAKQINALLAAMETWIDDIHTEILKERYVQRQYVDVSFEDFKSENIPAAYFNDRFEDLHASG